jgi:CRISPR-associated protein Cas1
MKKLLNTLYVATQGTYLSKERESLIVSVERQVRLRVPIHTLDGIVCFGNVLCSPFLLGFCAEKAVEVSFLTANGRFLARVNGPVSGNVLLRRRQYRMADDEQASADIARSCLIGKVANSRAVLQRYLRDHDDSDENVQQAVVRLKMSLERLKERTTVDELRGVEGDCGREYFSVFGNVIKDRNEDFYFKTRSRRPPLDNMNALLSFLYTLLAHDMRSALESVGLDPAVGYLHRDRPGRYGLALDLMEEFRPVLADRAALSLVNLKIVSGKGFRKSESGAVIMDDDTRRKVLKFWQERKKDEIQHPFINEKISIGLLPFVQSLLLARYLRGYLDAYPPFIWR